MSGFMVDGDVHSEDIDGGHSIFRDYGQFSKADSDFINSLSLTNTEDGPPQRVFALEDYGKFSNSTRRFPFNM